MKILEASFFGYPVTDMARARKFYEGILGLKPTKEPTTVPWIEYELGNATLGLGAYDEAGSRPTMGPCWPSKSMTLRRPSPS